MERPNPGERWGVDRVRFLSCFFRAHQARGEPNERRLQTATGWSIKLSLAKVLPVLQLLSLIEGTLQCISK